MTAKENSASQLQPSSVALHMLAGGAVGLTIIALFVFGVDHPDPAWGEYWRVRPLIVSPLMGALSGLGVYVVMNFHPVVNVSKPVAIVISVVGFLIGIWLGVVLGLDGTMWN